MSYQLQAKRGISMVEILVAISIIAIAFTGLLETITFSLRITNPIKGTIQANALAQEAMEATRAFRDGTDWDVNGLGTEVTDVSYRLEKSGLPPAWTLVQGEETINGFLRQIVFQDVRRDVNDNIVSSGGIIDLNTKKVVVTISWESEQAQVFEYLTNWKE